MALIGIAGVLKSLNLSAFEASLETWTVMPRSLRSLLTVGVPMLEMLVASAWFLDLGRRRAFHAAVSLLACFQIVVWAQLATGHPPKCGCFGVLERYFSMVSSGYWVAGRSAAMLAMLVIAWRLERTGKGSLVPIPREGIATARRGCAFTVIEVLLGLAVFAVLLTMLLPWLAGVRSSALRNETASRLRQHMLVFGAYANDWKDCFPLPSTPGLAEQTILLARSGRTVTFPGYFTGSLQWHSLLCEPYYNTIPEDPVFYPVEHQQKWGSSDGGGIFWMTCTVMAGPAYWNLSTRTGPDQYRAVRFSETLFPAKKSVLGSMHFVIEAMGQAPHWRTPQHGTSVPLSTVDGAVQHSGWGMSIPGIGSADGPYAGTFHTIDLWPAMHTIDGVRGRDVP